MFFKSVDTENIYTFLPALIGAVGALGAGAMSLVGGHKSANTNLQGIRETNQANRELAEYSYEKNLEMWERQNEYNSPINQMARFKDAGLNPNLIYGNGSGNAGNSNTSPSYQSPNLVAPAVNNDFGYSSAGAHLASAFSEVAQVRKTLAEEANIRQSTINQMTHNEVEKLQVVYQQYLNAKTKEEADAAFSVIQATLRNLDSSATASFASAQNSDANRFTVDAMRPVLLEYQKAQIENVVSSTLNNKKLTNAQIKKISSDINVNVQNISNLIESKRLTNAQSVSVELENKIKEVLLKNGVDLHGDVTERMIHQLLQESPEGFEESVQFFGGLVSPISIITKFLK